MASRPPQDFRASSASKLTLLDLFRIRDYRLIFASGNLENISRWGDMVVLGWLVLNMTESPWKVAMVATLRWAPMLGFAIFSGFIADRSNRWLIMVIAQSGSVLVTATLLALVVGDWIQTWHIFLASLALGLIFVLQWPSRSSFIYDLIGRSNVVRGMSMETVNYTIGKIFGPLLAGAVIELAGFRGAFLFLLVGYILPLTLMLQVRTRIPRASTVSQPVWQTLGTGLRYALGHKVIRGVLGATVIMNLVGFSAVQFFPVVAKDHLEVGAGLMGVLVSAEGMGVFIGAVFIASLGMITYHGRFFVFGLAIMLVALIAFALVPWYPLAFVMMLTVGLGGSGFATMQASIMLTSAPPERRGMTMGVMGLFIGVTPLGILMIGAMTRVVDTHQAIAIGGVAGLLMLLPVIFLTPLVWRPIIAPDGGSGEPMEPPAEPDVAQPRTGD